MRTVLAYSVEETVEGGKLELKIEMRDIVHATNTELVSAVVKDEIDRYMSRNTEFLTTECRVYKVLLFNTSILKWRWLEFVRVKYMLWGESVVIKNYLP